MILDSDDNRENLRIFPVLLLVGFICSDERHSLHQNLLLFIVALANGGYFALASSANLSEAILANKITYIGGCFLPMTSFIVVCEICKIRIKSTVMFIMHMVQTALYLCICTIGYTGLYYKTAEYHVLISLKWQTIP